MKALCVRIYECTKSQVMTSNAYTQRQTAEACVSPTHGDARQHEEGDAGGQAQQGIAQGTEQQAGEERVAPAHHITPAALATTAPTARH